MEIKEGPKGIERIEANGKLLAIIIRNKFYEEDSSFFTEEHLSFQVGIHKAKKGKRYRAHISLPFELLKNFNPNKIYYIKKGKTGIDFYDDKGTKAGYSVLDEGDLILFISGGHGCDVLDDTHMIEIKQGPYRGAEIEKKFLE